MGIRRYRSLAALSLSALVLSSCEMGIDAGAQSEGAAGFFASVSIGLLWWFFPALVLLCGINAVEVERSSALEQYSSSFDIFEGFGAGVANVWLLVSPLGYLYFAALPESGAVLTGFPNIDSIIFSFLIPAVVVALTAFLVVMFSVSESPLAKGIKMVWGGLCSPGFSQFSCLVRGVRAVLAFSKINRRVKTVRLLQS